MYMSSEMIGEVDLQLIKSQTRVKTLFAFMRLFSKVPELESMSCIGHFGDDTMNLPGTVSPSENTRISGDQSDRSHDEDLGGHNEGEWRLPNKVMIPVSKACRADLTSKKLEKTAGTAFFERRPRVQEAKRDASLVSQVSVTRWKLAAQAIERHPAMSNHYVFHSHKQDQCLHFKSEELLVHRVPNWPWDDLLRSVDGLVVGMVLWLACFLYGAIHLAAWNEYFPSLVEKWLWRSSSLYISFYGGLWTVLNYMTRSYKPLNAFWERWMDGGGEWWQNILIGTPVVICGSSLNFARVLIVIEAFMSIRELPAGAYDTPTWSQVFPPFQDHLLLALLICDSICSCDSLPPPEGYDDGCESSIHTYSSYMQSGEAQMENWNLLAYNYTSNILHVIILRRSVRPII